MNMFKDKMQDLIWTCSEGSGAADLRSVTGSASNCHWPVTFPIPGPGHNLSKRTCMRSASVCWCCTGSSSPGFLWTTADLGWISHSGDTGVNGKHCLFPIFQTGQSIVEENIVRHTLLYRKKCLFKYGNAAFPGLDIATLPWAPCPP